MPEQPLDLGHPARVHIIGIGGSGMSAIASVLQSMGHTVSGSDLADSESLDRIAGEGVEVEVGHDARHVAGADVVARSTAVPDTNVEVEAAGRSGLVVHSRADVLGAIAATRRTIAVAGTHGKTTTSSMLAVVLRESGWGPSFVVGGNIAGVGGGAVWSDGEWFVVEADESDGTFLRLGPEVALVTSVELDHVEHWGGVGDLVDGFDRFLAEATGKRIVCADDPRADELGRRHGAVTYGCHESADYRITDIRTGRSDSTFVLSAPSGEVEDVALAAPGTHNVQNAAGAVACAAEIGVPFEAAIEALAAYAGVGRRFELRGEVAGVTFVDDYAHLPTEVERVIEAARQGGFERVVTVFQPHRYSRTAALAHAFADSFAGSDVTAITDIYPSGEAAREGVSGKLVLDAVLDAHPWSRLAYTPTRDDQIAYLRATLRPGDLCLTLGAGDLTTLPDELQPLLVAGT